MNKNIKRVILAMGLIVLFLLVCFIISSTAMFQRQIDLVDMVVLILFGTPASLFCIFLLLVSKSNHFLKNNLTRVGFVIGIIIVTAFFATVFLKYSSTSGWLNDVVIKDYIQTTHDGKYEYRLELVNMFQQNSSACLYVKAVDSGEEARIKLDISTKEMHVIIGGEGSVSPKPANPAVWSSLIATESQDVYILKTTETLNRYKTYNFYIDMQTKTAIVKSD